MSAYDIMWVCAIISTILSTGCTAQSTKLCFVGVIPDWVFVLYESIARPFHHINWRSYLWAVAPSKICVSENSLSQDACLSAARGSLGCGGLSSVERHMTSVRLETSANRGVFAIWSLGIPNQELPLCSDFVCSRDSPGIAKTPNHRCPGMHSQSKTRSSKLDPQLTSDQSQQPTTIHQHNIDGADDGLRDDNKSIGSAQFRAQAGGCSTFTHIGLTGRSVDSHEPPGPSKEKHEQATQAVNKPECAGHRLEVEDRLGNLGHPLIFEPGGSLDVLDFGHQDTGMDTA